MPVRRARAALAAIVVGATASAGWAQAPLPPTGTTRPRGTLDRLRESTTRALPPLPPMPSPHTDTFWVPDRHVRVPGVAGLVHVPGHWEHRLAPHEAYVPPLVGVAPDGTTVYFPAGVRPVPDTRQSP